MDEPSGGQINSEKLGASQGSMISIPTMSSKELIDGSVLQIPGTGQSGDWPWSDQRRQGKHLYPVAQNSQQSVRYAISAKLKEALVAAQDMVESARNCDLIELSNSGFQLKAALQTLWSLRKQRESDWQDLIVMLQAAINTKYFESFSIEQCKAVQTILETHLSSTLTDVSDLENSLRILRKVKLDPWKGASDGDDNEHE